MGVTVGPDGIATITVTPNSSSSSTTNGSSGNTSGGGAIGGNQPFSSGGTGTPGSTPFVTSTQNAANSGQLPANTTSSQDMRIRLAPLHPADVIQGGSSILAPLAATGNGMIFPYTPTVSFTQAVNYMDLQLVHSNTDYGAYTRTPSATISVSGKFTVQNQAEGAYALACLHFLRAVSKMYFGEQDQQAGLPPPVLVFSGYGNYMFGTGGTQGLRVVLKNHNWSFDDSVDSINISIPASPSQQPPIGGTPIAQQTNLALGPNGGSGTARLPALFTVSCELMVIQTPQRMRQIFKFADFASGALMQGSNTGWI